MGLFIKRVTRDTTDDPKRERERKAMTKTRDTSQDDKRARELAAITYRKEKGQLRRSR